MNTWFPDGTLLFSLAQVVSGFLGLGPILDSKGSFKFTLFLSFPGCGVSFVFGFGFFGLGLGFWYGLPMGSFFFSFPVASRLRVGGPPPVFRPGSPRAPWAGGGKSIPL